MSIKPGEIENDYIIDTQSYVMYSEVIRNPE